MKRINILLVVALLAGLAMPALAEDSDDSERRSPEKNRIMQVRENILKARADFNNMSKERKAEMVKERSQNKEDLKIKLSTFKDENRKRIIEKLSEKIESLNDRITSHYLSVITKLETLLNRISERAERLAANGSDITKVSASVDVALASLAKARVAVATQAAKTYDVTPTSETSAKTDLGKVRKAFGEDLAAVRVIIKEAHSAVRAAAVALSEVEEVEEETESN